MDLYAKKDLHALRSDCVASCLIFTYDISFARLRRNSQMNILSPSLPQRIARLLILDAALLASIAKRTAGRCSRTCTA